MPRLLLVRHGQASFGSADYDRLSELGVRQAQLTAQALRTAGLELDRVLSGTLRRQRETAAPIAAAYGLTVEVDPRLDEYDADALLTHHSADAVRLERPGTPGAVPHDARAIQAPLEAALPDWIAAGADSPAGETFPAFAARVAGAVADALGDGARTTLACSSGGVIGAVCAAMSGGGERSFAAFNRVAVNCGLTRVVSGRGGSSLVSFNEQLHLAPELITYR